MIKQKSIIIIFMALLLAGGSLPAYARATFNGGFGLSYLNFADEGNRADARDLNDTYDGFNFQSLTAFGNINPKTRYFARLDEINLDSRKGRIELTNLNLFRLKADFPNTDLQLWPGQ